MSIEKLRLENMKRNAEIFAAFRLDKMIVPLRRKREPESKRPKFESKPTRRPTRNRRSTRMKNLPSVEYNEVELEDEEDDDEEYESPLEPMTLSQCLEKAGESDAVDYLVEDVFGDLESSSTWHSRKDNKNVEEIGKFTKTIKTLQKSKTCVAKVTKAETSSLAFHPISEKAILMVGGTKGDLCFWDANNRDQLPVFLQPHSHVVSMVATHPSKLHQVVTTSHDGTVRITDLNTHMVLLPYGNREFLVTSMDFLSSDTILRGDNDGLATVTDFREEKDRKSVVFNCYVGNDNCVFRHVKAISVNPQRQHMVSTATSEGAVLIWDIRNPRKWLVNLPHIRAVHWCEFSSQGNYLLTSSLCDQVRVYDTSKLVEAEKEDILPERTIIHNYNGGSKHAFRSRWIPRREDCFIIGSGSPPRQIEIYSTKSGERMASIANHTMQTTIRFSVYHPSLNILVGVTSSGLAHVFYKP